MTIEQQGEILVEIAAIVNHLSNKKNLAAMSGDDLSYTQVKLASLKASIIDLKVEAHSDMLQLEIVKDQAKGVAYQRYKKTDGVTAAADMKNMDEDYAAARNSYSEAVVNYEKLKSITANVHDVIESIKSRLIDLGGARKDER